MLRSGLRHATALCAHGHRIRSTQHAQAGPKRTPATSATALAHVQHTLNLRVYPPDCLAHGIPVMPYRSTCCVCHTLGASLPWQ